jgi:hypothetical protein
METMIKKLMEELEEETIIKQMDKSVENSSHMTDDEKQSEITERFIESGVDLKEPKLSKEKFEKMFPLMGRLDYTNWLQLRMVMSQTGEKDYIKHLSIFYKHKFGRNPIGVK